MRSPWMVAAALVALITLANACWLSLRSQYNAPYVVSIFESDTGVRMVIETRHEAPSITEVASSGLGKFHYVGSYGRWVSIRDQPHD